MVAIEDLQIELVDSVERLSEMSPEWEALARRSAASDIFVLPRWLLAWVEAIGCDKQMHFVCMFKGGELCGLFPLCRRRRGPVRAIYFAGTPRYSDRLDILLEAGCEDACVDAFVNWLYGRGDWDVLSLRGFAPLSDHAHRLAGALERGGRRFLLEQEGPQAYIDLRRYEDFDAYLKEVRSGQVRHNLRRLRRRLEREHEVQWEWAQLSAGLIDEMAELDRQRSIRGRHDQAFFCRSLSRDFLAAVGRRLAPEQVRLVTCRIDGRLASYCLNFDHDERLLSYQSAFDSHYYRDSLGSHTLLEAVWWGFEHGYREFDFLTGDEDYKNHWTDSARHAWRLYAYRNRWRSRMVYGYHRWLKPLRRYAARNRRLRNLVPESLRERFDI